MCLNEKLTYNIKVKSRNCELFVLKKNDFLRLSVNFKEFIEKFLQKSLMKYLRFNEEKKKIYKTIDDKNLISGGLDRSKSDNNNSLEMIDEDEDENDSEEYNIYESNSSLGEEDSKIVKENIDEDDSEKNANQNKKESANDNKKGSGLKLGKNKMSYGNSNENKSSESKLFLFYLFLESESDQENINDENKFDVEIIKKQMNKKFNKKVDKIIEFMEKNKVESNGEDKNTLILLKKLKSIENLSERNEMIDNIENIITENFK